jgi:hypothetical protein
LSFLSLDEAGQWWIAAINGPCEAPSLSALLPVTQPERVYFEASRIEKERRTFYWVLDDTRLTLYEWQNNTAVSLWTMDNAPGSAVTPSVRQDFTGDGKPELALTWKRNPVDKEHPVDLLQIYRMKDTNFELISELESDYHQYSDVDGDNIAEYLWPVPPEAPKTWKVYGWNGERFEWKASLTKPAIHPITPKVGFPLPICSFDLVKIQHYEGSSYSVTTSDSTITWKIPNTFTYVSGYSTFGWDPNCKYLIHARADGENGLYRIDLKTGNVKTLLSLANTRAYGAVHPIVLQNGDIVFTIQGVDATLYPPPGIYLLASSGELQLLADIDPLKDTGDRDSPVDFGSLKVLRSGEVNYQSP